MSWNDMSTRMSQFANEHPIQFVAVTSFIALGGIPIATFLVYAIATVIASLVGALVFELFLLALGITGLAFALFFVVCISSGVVSVFMALYYSYQFATGTLKRVKQPWRHSVIPRPSESSDTQSDDKNKSNEIIEMDNLSSVLDFVDSNSDFFRTALVTLILLFAVVVMFSVVFATSYFVVNFT